MRRIFLQLVPFLRALPVGLTVLSLAAACAGSAEGDRPESRCAYARYFDLTAEGNVVTISPYDGRRDTLAVERPLDNLVCMSSSHIGYLAGLGCDSTVSAVSGIGYISDPRLRRRYEATRSGLETARPLYDVGYEAAVDYERVLALQPDLLLT